MVWPLTSSQAKKPEPPPFPPPWSFAYAQDYVARLPTETLAISSFCLGASTYAIASFIRRRYFVRIPSADWVTPDMLKTRWFKGRVTAYVYLLP